jgi:hypothetical protein
VRGCSVTTTVTEPISTPAEDTRPKWTERPALMAGASAGLGAVLAAIVVLVWAFANGPQSVQERPSSDSAPAAAAPAAPVEAPKPALPGGLPGMPGGLTEAGTPGGAQALDPAALFSSSARTSSGGGSVSSPALPKLPELPKPPNAQQVLDAVAPYTQQAFGWNGLGGSLVSANAITNLAGDIGGWLTAAGVSTANNATELVAALIVAGAIPGLPNATSDFASLMGVPQALMNLPSPLQLPTPTDALGDVAKTLSISLPALDQLGKLPSTQFGLPQLPPPPPMGMPKLPPPPQFGMPKLPPPPPIGLPGPPEFGLPSLPILSAFS